MRSLLVGALAAIAVAGAACTFLDSLDYLTNGGPAGDGGGGGGGTGGAPTPITLASAQSLPTTLVLDSSNVYWASTSGTMSTLVTIPKSGGATPKSIRSAPGTAVAAAIDPSGGALYWGLVTLTGAAIERVDVGGSAQSVGNPTYDLSWLAVDEGSVYWTESLDGDGGSGAVRRTGKQGGPAQLIYADDPNAFDPIGLTFDSSYVYFSDNATPPNTTIFAYAKTSDAGVIPLANVVASPADDCQFAVDGSRFIWASNLYDCDGTTTSTGAVCLEAFTVQGRGGTGIRLGSYGAMGLRDGTPACIAIDETYVYWTTTNGNVVRAPKMPGDDTVLATNQPGPHDIAVDSSGVYWINTGTSAGAGAVMKIAK